MLQSMGSKRVRHDLMTKQQYTWVTNAGEGVWKRKPSYNVGGTVNWCSRYGKQYGGSSKTLKIELPCDSVIPLLGTYPDNTIILKDTCTPIFTAELFTIVKTWKQSKCPSPDKWIKQI